MTKAAEGLEFSVAMVCCAACYCFSLTIDSWCFLSLHVLVFVCLHTGSFPGYFIVEKDSLITVVTISPDLSKRSCKAPRKCLRTDAILLLSLHEQGIT